MDATFDYLTVLLQEPRQFEDASVLPTGPEANPAELGVIVDAGHLGIPWGLLLPLADFGRQLFLGAKDLAAAMAVTPTLLMVNGWHTEAWHTRKRCIVDAGMSDFAGELALNGLVLHVHPKAEPAWAHRRWCLRRVPRAWDASMYESERALCERLGELHAHNYHAWAHRGWVATEAGADSAHWHADMAATLLWTQRHRADHCGWHHRVLLLTASTRQQCAKHGQALHDRSFDPVASALMAGSVPQPPCGVCAAWHVAVAEAIAALVDSPDLEAPWAHLTTLLASTHMLSVRLHASGAAGHDDLAIYVATLHGHFGGSHPLALGQLLLTLSLLFPGDPTAVGGSAIDHQRLLATAPSRYAALAADLAIIT